ncbi:ATP-grasp domain-containing protein [Sphingobium terrigena]|uniref:ATP-grasp domain-containing protein n=1 Tax=Sphingobium terrigena TaxID=2304063 RepID=A0A418YYB7_9SPHN|nr:biotin carboxylase N-terminal domain-containing protein [Sphingobium terrigena]RJG57868.1 ATP-grasp domain-containing protein [Sphingobium terrigena]
MIRPISSVLVANRGEIAVRILRSVRKAGLTGVIVHHAVDADTPAVRMADKAVPISGSTPVAAYLDGPQIVAAALAAGADAIHPGYGFLSENAEFARACDAAGIVFIGPRAETIDLMGDKVRARNFVESRGFPVAPSAIEDNDPATFVERARAVGAPLLIKPSAGGGGKGMRIVRDLALLEEEIERGRNEGLRYFGDGRLFAERYVERPRHIEVQVLGDAHGNVVHLFERECSLQRRFQKVVEEAPSPTLPPDERARICEVAAGIARAAGYVGAGTVEFIYGRGEFFFLEMNTRIQVEHPVTEEVTGVDLVSEQLRVAAGEPLGYGQNDLAIGGHAIEVRVYAEDAARGFVPTTGPLLVMIPPSGDGIRIDSGVEQGGAVTAAFDPMIAKLIVHAPSRAEALDKADAALADFVILGCRTNIGYLRRLLRDPDVRAGAIHTGLIGEKPDLAADPVPDDGSLRRVLAAAALSTRAVVDAADVVPALHAAIGGWRN